MFNTPSQVSNKSGSNGRWFESSVHLSSVPRPARSLERSSRDPLLVSSAEDTPTKILFRSFLPKALQQRSSSGQFCRRRSSRDRFPVFSVQGAPTEIVFPVFSAQGAPTEIVFRSFLLKALQQRSFSGLFCRMRSRRDRFTVFTAGVHREQFLHEEGRPPFLYRYICLKQWVRSQGSCGLSRWRKVNLFNKTDRERVTLFSSVNEVILECFFKCTLWFGSTVHSRLICTETRTIALHRIFNYRRERD